MAQLPERRTGSYFHQLRACALQGAASAGQGHGGAMATPTVCLLQGKPWAWAVSTTAQTGTDRIPGSHWKRKSPPNGLLTVWQIPMLCLGTPRLPQQPPQQRQCQGVGEYMGIWWENTWLRHLCPLWIKGV